MKCRVHGYKRIKNCKYCEDYTLWVDNEYKITKRDKKLKWKMNNLKVTIR